MSFLKLSQLISILFSVSILIFSFQNCSQGGFRAVQEATINSSSTSLALSSTKIMEPEMNSSSQGNLVLKGSCSTDVTVNISGDIVTELSVPCSYNLFTANVVLSSGDGNKNIVVKQIDFLGNEKVDSRSFVKDTTPPSLDLMNIANSVVVVKNVIALMGICETGLPVNVRIGTMPNQVFTCSSGMFSGSINLASLVDGGYLLEVSQTDLAGLKTAKQRNVMKDTLAPQVLMITPNTGTIVTSPISLSGICEVGADVVVTGTGVLNPPLTLPCVNAAFATTLNLVSGAGLRQVIVSQTDAAGNVGSETKVFQAQASAVPSLPVKITGPAVNTLAKDGVTLVGTCQNGLNVEISGSGVVATTATCSGGQFSKAINFSAGDGSKLVTVMQVDSSTSATGTDSRSFLRDATAPTVTIAMPAANTATKDSIALAGMCESGLSVSISGSGVATAIMVNCTSNSYSSPVVLAAGDGSKQVDVSQTDAAGNKTTQSRVFLKDNTAPALTITSPAVNTSAANGVTITGSCETGLLVSLTGTGVKANVTANCVSSAFSASIIFSDGDGSKIVDVSQTDVAGNMSVVSRTFVRSTPPIVYDGAQLYTTNCSGCHKPLESSEKKGKTAANITSAISSIGAMKSLSSLSASQIQAIADALSPPAVTPQISLTGVSFPVSYSSGSLRVCASGCAYTLPSQAMAAAVNGSVIEIEQGQYNDCLSITKNSVTVRGVFGYAHLHSKICNQKGGIVNMGRDTVLENLELSGFDSSDFSTASIRHDALGFNLKIKNMYFHDGQNGMLLSAAGDEIVIQDTLFERVGAKRPDGEISVPVYSSGVANLLFIRKSKIVSARGEATEIKTKAKKTIIDCSVIANLDGPDSYSVNAQTGGDLVLTNNVIEKSPLSVNSVMISYADVSFNAGASNLVQIEGNTFLMDYTGGSVLRVVNGTPQVSFVNNTLVGTGLYLSGSSSVPSGNFVSNTRTPAYPGLPSPGPCVTAAR